MSDYNALSRAYWFALLSAGACIALWALREMLSLDGSEWAKFLALLSLVVISSARPIRIPGTNACVTASDCFIFLGVIFLGVPAAVFLCACDLLTSTLCSTRRKSSWLAAPAIGAVTIFIAGQSFYYALAEHSAIMRNPLGTTYAVSLSSLLFPLMLTAILQYFINGFSVATIYALKGRKSVWTFWREGYLWTFWSFFAGAIAALIIYGATMQFGLVYVLLSAPVIWASYATYKIYFERVNEKTREADELARIHLSTVEALATAIDAKDQTTHCHVRRVQIYATRMAEMMGLSRAEIKALQAGALLHDIGKLAVPDHILNKPGRLTPAEFERMKIHTLVGAQILERVAFPYPVVPIVRHHHEQWNGEGYPDGLKGEEIPVTARILSVVDCFDSVREDRPYRKGMTSEEACALLRRGAGEHLDPRIVELFIARLPEFELEIEAEGLNQKGFTNIECDARAILADADASAPLLNADEGQGASLAYLQHINNAHREVYALYEIARTFGSSLDIEETVAVLVNKVGHVVPFDLCAVYLYDGLKNVAVAAHVAGRNAELVRGRTVAHGEGVIGFVLANQRPALHLDPSLDFADMLQPEGRQYRSMVALPLIKDEQLLGALAVYSMDARRYTDEHLRLLETVARLASDALANAVQHAEAESHALTDTLTGLPNARAMYARFEQEASRARRTGLPFQVVMLDLDDFKQVNDNFGHRTGDQMLREVARIVQAQLREYDFLARYAGDEFIALVQELSPDQTEELSARIENAVSRFSLHVRGDRYARVGISVGAATYGLQGETIDQLIIAADENMYAAKSDHKRQATEAADKIAPLATGDLASTAVN